MNDNAGHIPRILHVEDDQDTREITAIALELTGAVTLLQCTSGEEAIEKAAAFGPDVILLDVMMQTMHGPEVFAAFRQIPEVSDVPVIFMTGRVQQNEVNELMSLGALSVIAKPFEPLELLGTIESALRRAPAAKERVPAVSAC